jgi:hypothetical protein
MRPVSHRLFCWLAIVLLAPALAWGTSSPLDAAAATLQKVSGQPVRPFSTRDFGREPYAAARSVLVREEDAERVLLAIRPQMPKGIVAFVGTTRSLARPKAVGVEIVVAEGSDQFDILRIAASDGINHGLQTEDLVRELKAWDQEFGIDIWQAESDTIQLRLKSLPKDMARFAKRVYKFCPDIVNQGAGSVHALHRDIVRQRALLLWWD